MDLQADEAVRGIVAAKIEVEKLGEEEFLVRVGEGSHQTTHRVTLKAADYQRLAEGRISAEELVRKSFEFLLERESSESILSRFDLMVIGRYFPEFEREMKRQI
jgi:hypothetical protein